MGVAYATCNRGGCHLRAWTPGVESTDMDPHTTDGKSEWVVHEQHRSTAHDATGLCLFVSFANGGLEAFVPITAAATGIDYTVDDFVKIGERTWNLERMWNLKAGLTKADDSLPKRLTNESHKEGPSQGVTVDLDTMLPIYYEERGWDKRRCADPGKARRTRLGIAVAVGRSCRIELRVARSEHEGRGGSTSHAHRLGSGRATYARHPLLPDLTWFG